MTSAFDWREMATPTVCIPRNDPDRIRAEALADAVRLVRLARAALVVATDGEQQAHRRQSFSAAHAALTDLQAELEPMQQGRRT